MKWVRGLLLALLVVTAFNQQVAAKSDLNCERLLGGIGTSEAGRSPATESERKLRVMSYNMLDLKVADGPTSNGKKHKTKNGQITTKSDWALQQQADIIIDQSPDIVVMEEVVSAEDLQRFNDRFLGGQYKVFFQRGNDSRGIEVAMLVKNSILADFRVEYRSHKDMEVYDEATGANMPVFSRDAPSLILKDATTGDTKLVVVGVHSKSKRPRPGDPESQKLRTKQMEAVRTIVKSFQSEFGEATPILLAGDFNTGLHNSPETADLFEVMTDVFDLLARPPPEADRITHSFHPNDGATSYQQLDGILLVNGSPVRVEDARVIRYRDRSGNIKRLPQSYKERSENPSDHFPIVADLIIPR